VNEFVDPCDPEFGFPVQGEFQGKGAMQITDSDGPVDREGAICRLSFTTHLTGAFPELNWTGNFVAHCDDGAKIHGTVAGPTGEGLEPGGISQVMTGVIHDK
jgi:hypothetical protein